MHIKTNIEITYVQIVILAICPFIIISNSNVALNYLMGTLVCFLISQFVCVIFNRFLSGTMKSFLTAMVSVIVVTVLNLLLENHKILNFSASEQNYYMVLSAVVLSVNFSRINTKALTTHYFLNVLKTIFVYAICLMMYAVIKEFLSYGTIFEKSITRFAGFEFFKTVAFGLILLAFICVIVDSISRIIEKKIEARDVVYQKLIKKIRNEKIFQYDTLRRKKVLANSIEVNKIGSEQAEKIIQQSNENISPDESEEEVDEDTKDENVEPGKKKKKRKLKVSKEAKVEQVKLNSSREEV